MKEFLEYVAAHLVDRPEELTLVAEPHGDKEIHFALTLPRSEVGKIIGKQGHTIRAIRNLINAAVSRYGQRVMLEIVERPGEEPGQ